MTTTGRLEPERVVKEVIDRVIRWQSMNFGCSPIPGGTAGYTGESPWSKPICAVGIYQANSCTGATAGTADKKLVSKVLQGLWVSLKRVIVYFTVSWVACRDVDPEATD
jgi:hypothetical protein